MEMIDGIKDFIISIQRALGNMDLATIEPMNYTDFHPLFSKQWIDKWEEVINTIENRQIPLSKLVKTISGPAHLRSQFYFMLIDLKCAKIEKEKRIKIANFFHNLLEKTSIRDIHGRESNIIHHHKNIQNILKKTKFNKGSPDISKLLGRLYSAAYHLTNGLYTDFYTDFGVECQGEYRLDNNHILVIRQFNDLNPKEIWPKTNSPCKTIKIYTIYKNVRFKTDSISVHSIWKGDLINNLIVWAVEIDNKLVKSTKQIKKLKELEKIEFN